MPSALSKPYFQKHALCLLKHADLPNYLWGQAVLHSVYLKNRSPSTRADGLSPLQFHTGTPFDFKNIRVFGCPAQIFVRPSVRVNPKLSDRSESGTFVGMSTKGNGYIFLVPRSKSLLEIDSKDVLFNEMFSDCRDRQGRIIARGAVVPPDLTDEPHPPTYQPADYQDGIVRNTISLPPATISNPFGCLYDPHDTPDESTDPDDASPSPPAPTDVSPPAPHQLPSAKPASKF